MSKAQDIIDIFNEHSDKELEKAAKRMAQNVLKKAKFKDNINVEDLKKKFFKQMKAAKSGDRPAGN